MDSPIASMLCDDDWWLRERKGCHRVDATRQEKEQHQQQEILDVNVNKIGDDISAQDEWIWVIFVHQRVNTKNKERRRRKDKTPTNGALHWILIWLFVDAQCVHLRIDKKMWDCHRVDSNVDRWTCSQHCNYGCCCLCNWPFAVQVRGHSPLFKIICHVFYSCLCVFLFVNL